MTKTSDLPYLKHCFSPTQLLGLQTWHPVKPATCERSITGAQLAELLVDDEASGDFAEATESLLQTAVGARVAAYGFIFERKS